MFTLLALIVNLKWYACRKWTSSLKLVVILAQCRYAKTAQRIFKCSDTQYTSLTLDIILNSLVYRTLFHINIYGSYKLLKTVQFLAHPVQCILSSFRLRYGHWRGVAAPEISIWGYSPGSLGTPEAEAVCRHCLRILTAETINIWKFRTIHLLSFGQFAWRWGLNPLAHAWRRHWLWLFHMHHVCSSYEVTIRRVIRCNVHFSVKSS